MLNEIENDRDNPEDVPDQAQIPVEDVSSRFHRSKSSTGILSRTAEIERLRERLREFMQALLIRMSGDSDSVRWNVAALPGDRCHSAQYGTSSGR